MKEADIVVIGGGPGGYVCAIRAAQLGLKTLLVEEKWLGGECLWAGCIPSKSLITVAKLYEKVREAEKFGLRFDGARIDFAALQKWKSEVISKLVSGIEALCKGNGVEVVMGGAEVGGRESVFVSSKDGLEEVRTKKIVIATGTRPAELPGIAFDGRVVISSKEALELTSAPDELLVVGGGVVGMEFACMYQKLGSRITVVELTDQLLPGTDPDLVRVVQKNLEANGGKVYLKSRVSSIEKRQATVVAKVETGAAAITVQADKLLLSVGRKPRTEKLNLARIGVEADQRGFIKTDEHMMTTVSGIYAIGDVRGPPLLAHKAFKEGVVAAESAAGLPTAAEWATIPDAIFTDPEIATAGLTEARAVAAGYTVKKNRFPFAALGRALSTGEPEGFVRVVSDASNGLVLGVQIVGPEASNLISEAALAIEMGATVEDVALTIHPHPTLPEAFMEAAEAAEGKPVHQLKV
ncbi:MAG: dihydrolipoyl dehydrogenase [Thaumarchaeota archaeon]|nr:MAG: dihydrolipoyl dehydrogenase [Nitrososphaerota archaeon]